MFVVIAIIGFKWSAMVVAAGMVAHGIFDLAHNQLIENAGVPAWWPAYCAVVDIILGAWVIYSARRSN